MANDLVIALWKLPMKGKSMEKFVLMFLADRADDNGYCWYSLQAIADACCISRRYTIELIERLERDGLVEIERRRVSEHKNLTNLYRVVIPTSLPGTEVVNPSSPPLEEVVIYSSPPEQGVVNPSSPGSEPQFTRVVIPSSPESTINHHESSKDEEDDDEKPAANGADRKSGDRAAPAAVVGTQPRVKLRIHDLYEQTIGPLLPILEEELEAAARTYPPGWIDEAFALAAKHSGRSWAYVEKILIDWEANGKNGGKNGKSNGKSNGNGSKTGSGGADSELVRALRKANQRRERVRTGPDGG